MKRIVEFLSLFASMSTLVCCALPALLVSLGLGAALASTVTAVPGLIWLSEQKIPLFIFAGVMLALGFFAENQSRKLACPADPNLAAACSSSKKVSSIVLKLSLALYLVGFFFAFLAPIFL